MFKLVIILVFRGFQLEDGVQTLEAMLHTVDRINSDPDLLPGIKLGLLAYDSCDNPTTALEHSTDFVKGEGLRV